jgi:hypothetical protein
LSLFSGLNNLLMSTPHILLSLMAKSLSDPIFIL